MERKFLIKFTDGVIRGPFLQSEVEDMIYNSSLNGQEQISEYPTGDWDDIAKNKHFYDVFIGAFETDKNVHRYDKETFVDIPTATDIKKKTAEEISEQTRIVDELNKQKENIKQQEQPTTIYDKKDLQKVNESVIKSKTNEAIDPEQKSPIIPQAVIVSLENEEEKKEQKKSKTLLVVSVLLVLGVLLFLLTKQEVATVVNVDGVKFDKITVEVILPVAESSTHSPAEAAKLRNEAVKLINNDDISSYKKAVKILLDAYELDTTASSSLSYLVYSYSRLYSVSKQDAEYVNTLNAILSRAQRTDTNIQTLTLAKMGFALMQGDHGSALLSFNEMLSVIKDSSKISEFILLLASEASIGQNDYNSAFQVLNNRVNKNNTIYPRGFYLEGLVRINNKEYELATDSFNKALLINPDHASSQVKLFELGKNANMASMFNYLQDKYLFMNFPDTATMLYLIGNSLVQGGAIEKAKHFYQKSLDFMPTNSKALIAYEQLGGDISKYKKIGEIKTASNPETITFMIRGDELFRTQKYRDASLQYRMASSLDPNNINALYKLGEAYRLSYEYVKSTTIFEEVIKLDKLNLNSLIKLARVQTELYQFVDAMNHLKKAQEIDPQNPDVLFAIGYLNEKRNLEANAVEFYHKAVSKDFTHIESLMALGKINYKYERYPEAKLLFEKIVSTKPDMFEAYMYITEILGKTEHISKVEKYVKNLENMFPEIAEINTGMARAQINRSAFIEAEAELKKALLKNKYSISTLKTYAELSERLGRTKDSLSYYETIIIIAPYYLEAVKRRADIYCNLKQLANCEKELIRLTELAPRFPRAYYTLGTMYYESNQFEDAKESLTREIQYNPYIRDSYVLLGDVYIKMGTPQDAVDMFRKMLVTNKKDPYALLGLAKSYFEVRDFPASESVLLQAKQIDPNINEIYYVECMLYFHTNMFAESKYSCEEYIKRAPHDAKANEARDIISQISK